MPSPKKIKLALLGTRGIPNQYGGFEQFAEQFGERFAAKGHEVTVYCSSTHPYKQEHYKGITLVHCYDPEQKIGTAGQFIYDLCCILDSRKRNYDIILQLGYTSSTVWSRLFPKKKTIIATNMDGLEWKRSQYNKAVQFFLKHAEKWGVRHSHHLIADSRAIRQYLADTYKKPSVFVPYGADLFAPDESSASILTDLKLEPYQYDLLIARFEPENNLEMILKSYAENGEKKLLVIGRHEANAFGKKLYQHYHHRHNIQFLGAVFDMQKLNYLRYYSRLYLHGHSVGGTNPSLLEAMAANALVAAHDNVFNRDVLGNEAFYFAGVTELNRLLAQDIYKENYKDRLAANRKKMEDCYNWELITQTLENLFYEWIGRKE